MALSSMSTVLANEADVEAVTPATQAVLYSPNIASQIPVDQSLKINSHPALSGIFDEKIRSNSINTLSNQSGAILEILNPSYTNENVSISASNIVLGLFTATSGYLNFNESNISQGMILQFYTQKVRMSILEQQTYCLL